MDFLIEASKTANTSLINSETKGLQEAINESWISSSTAYLKNCVYFVQAGVGGYIKIGRSVKSTGFNGRLVALQSSCPTPLRSLIEMTYDEYILYDEYGVKALESYLIDVFDIPEGFVDYVRQHYNAINYPMMGERRGKSQAAEARLENKLQNRFEEFCSAGEWHYPSIELLTFISEFRGVKIIDDPTYNPKKAAIVQCIVCGKLTLSSTLKCRVHGYGSNRNSGKCLVCGKKNDSPKFMRAATCQSCYFLYLEKTRKFHKKLFV